MEFPCPSCQTPNDPWAATCRVCGKPLENPFAQPSPPRDPGMALPAWAESMKREAERWERDGLIGADLARHLAERYSWRRMVLGELERLQQEGILPNEVAQRLRQRYAPPEKPVAPPEPEQKVVEEKPVPEAAPMPPPPAAPLEEPATAPAGQPLPEKPVAIPEPERKVAEEGMPEVAPAVSAVDLVLDAADLAEETPEDRVAAAAAPLTGLNRFLQAFVEEANLHWLLYVGIFLIVASSVFLVASQWAAIHYSLQYLILLVYTSGFYWAAWQMLSRFELRRTGHALVVVTTLLIPLNFWGMQVLGLFRDAAGWVLAVPASAWLGLMTYLCASHVHRLVGLRFTSAFVPLAMAQAVIGFWSPSWASMAVTLLVVGTVGWWTRSEEPPFADAADRKTTWIFMLGGLAYVALLTTGRIFAETGLSPFDPLAGPLVGLWALAVLMVAHHFRDAEHPDRATPLHIVSYVLALFGMWLARPEPVWLWLSSAIAIPVYLQAVRTHVRPLYFYLAALAVAVTYYYSPALFPVIAGAFRDNLATSLGYSRLPWPFYGVTLFPLALLALGVGFALLKRGQPLARHALGLSVALGLGCLGIAWNDPVSLAWSLALTTLYGVLLVQVVPYLELPYAPSATGLLAVLALGNWIAHQVLYTGPDPLRGNWKSAGLLVLAGLAALWTAAGYRLWWSWRWAPAEEGRLPSLWQQPLVHVGMAAAAVALFSGGWDRLPVLVLTSAVALAATHMNPHGLFMVTFLALFQVTLISTAGQYLHDNTWPLVLVLLYGLFAVGAIGLAAVMGRIPLPPVPFQRLGRWLRLALDARTWDTQTWPPAQGLWRGWYGSAVLYGMSLLLVQVVFLGGALLGAWRASSDDWYNSYWFRAALLLVPFLQVLWIYIAPRLAMPFATLGALSALYVLILPFNPPPLGLVFPTIGFIALVLLAAQSWETAPPSFFALLGLPEGMDWRRDSLAGWYPLVPFVLILSLLETGGRLEVGTSIAMWLATLVWLGYSIFRQPGHAYVALSLLTLGCYWLLFRHAYLHASGGELADLGVPMAVIALAFAFIWAGATWILEDREQRGIGGTQNAATGPSHTPSFLRDWCGRGIFHHLAIGHAILAFACVTVSMAGSANPPIGLVLTALGVYAALSVLAVGFASQDNRRGMAVGAESWIYFAQLSLAFIYAYLRLTTDWLTRLDEYAPIALILGAFILIGVKQLAEREGVAFAVRPTYVVALLASVGTILTVGWRFLAEGWLTLNNPLAIWLAAGFFTHLAVQSGGRSFAYAAALLFNGGLYLLWWTYGVTDQQSFLIPAGVLVLWFAQFNRHELPRSTINQLRLAGLLIIYGSSAFALLQVGSGLPALILAVVCALGILAGIALRIRSYLYLGAIFLFVDVGHQLWFFSTQYAPGKWIVGFSLGLLFVALAVLFESRREAVLARIKMVTEELAHWE